MNAQTSNPAADPATQPADSATLALTASDDAPRRGRDFTLVLRIGLPLALFAIVVWSWETYVRVAEVPHYILPAPSRIMETMIADWPLLFGSLLQTLETTFLGLSLAIMGGVGLAVLLSLSRAVEYSLYPYAVVLQVTPVVAIAPLLLIYMPQETAVLTCAWIVAFFPILSNTTLGLNSVDRNLIDYFKLNGASRWQTLWHLRLPAAMPFFPGGLKIAGGLALIGAVVAEFVAGTAGQSSGLASRIIEAGYRLN